MRLYVISVLLASVLVKTIRVWYVRLKDVLTAQILFILVNLVNLAIIILVIIANLALHTALHVMI